MIAKDIGPVNLRGEKEMLSGHFFTIAGELM